MSRDIHIITLLLSNGANVNYKNALNESAILISSFNGYVEIVNLLLSNGANINDTDQYGDTPLLLSIHNGQLKMAKFLLGNKGINVSIKNKKGDPALSLATEEDYDELIPLITSSRM